MSYGVGVGYENKGAGGGGTVSGSGTPPKIAQWTAPTTIGDGTWQFIGDDIVPCTTASNIGTAALRVDTIFMASNFDYASEIEWINGANTRMRLTTGGNLGIGTAVASTARIETVGAGTTNATSNVLFQNGDATPDVLMHIRDDGSFSIGINAVPNLPTNVIIGNGASTTASAGAMAIGSVAEAQNADVISVGRNAGTVTGTVGSEGIAIGIGANGLATAQNMGGQTIAIGSVARAQSSQMIAIGTSAGNTTGTQGVNTVLVGTQAGRAGLATRNIGADSVAIGSNTVVENANSVAVGSDAITQAAGAIAIGKSAGNTSGTVNQSSVSLGLRANAGTSNIGLNSVAIGVDSLSTQTGAISIGDTALASGIDAIAIGNRSDAIAADAIAIGETALASGTIAIAIGNVSIASGIDSIAIGRGAETTTTGSNAIGRFAGDVTGTVGTNFIAIGSGANGNGNPIDIGTDSIAIGTNAQATTLQSIAIGHDAVANGGTEALAIGDGAEAVTFRSVAIGTAAGNSSGTIGDQYVSIGSLSNQGATNIGLQSTAVGYLADSIGTQSASLGYNAVATGDQSVAVGAESDAGLAGAVGIGHLAQALGADSIAIGPDTIATNTESMALGSGSNATGLRAIAITAGVTTANAQTDSLLIGTQSFGGNFPQVNHSQCIVIGMARALNTSASGQMVVSTDTLFIGSGADDSGASATNATIQTANKSGVANENSGNMTIKSGLSTGNVAGGLITFQQSFSGAAGSSQNASNDVFELDASNSWAIFPSYRVGIGTSTPNADAILDLTSTTGALLLPRMTTTQRNALTATEGMFIANTTTNQAEYYNGTSWVIAA